MVDRLIILGNLLGRVYEYGRNIMKLKKLNEHINLIAQLKKWLFFCRDEAARMWQKRDAEWEREKRARERLMKEVILYIFSRFYDTQEFITFNDSHKRGI